MDFFKRNFNIILLLGTAFLFFLPTITLPYSLIDDWETLKVTSEATEALLAGNFSEIFDKFVEIPSGRFRPGYWIFQWLFIGILQQNSTLNHFGRILILLLVIWLISGVTERLTRSKITALFAGFFFLFFGPNAENWIRLGPQETPLLLFSLVSLASIINAWEKKSNFWMIVSLFFLGLAYLTKETALMLLPASAALVAAVSGEKRKIVSKYLGANIIFALLLLAPVMVIRGGTAVTYSSNYQFNLPGMVGHLADYLGILTRGYNLLWWLLLATFAWRIFAKRRLEGLEWFQLFALSWFFTGFLLQLPWRYVLGRYLLPISAPLAMFLATEIVVIAKRFHNGWLGFGQVILGMLLFLFAFQGMVDGATFFRDTFARDYGHHQALTFVAQNMSDNGRLFLNFSKAPGAVEWPFGLRTNLTLVYNRPDIEVVQLKAGQPYHGGDYIFDWSANREYDLTQLGNLLPKEAMVIYQNHTFGIIPGPPLIMVLLLPTRGRVASFFGTPFPYQWTIFTI